MSCAVKTELVLNLSSKILHISEFKKIPINCEKRGAKSLLGFFTNTQLFIMQNLKKLLSWDPFTKSFKRAIWVYNKCMDDFKMPNVAESKKFRIRKSTEMYIRRIQKITIGRFIKFFTAIIILQICRI